MEACVSISRESLDTRCENQEVTKGDPSRTAHIKKPTSPSSHNQHSFVTHSFVYATIMIMKCTLVTISIFVSAVFAQQTSFPSQCISPCSGVLSISDSCANSTGYNFDADVVLAQEYLNCICASSNTGIMNSYTSFSMSPVMLDVCNVLSKPVTIWVGSWTPSRHVHRGRQISIPLQASMATISLESLRTFQGQPSHPLQPPPQPVLRYSRSST
jgi:hypothetical protein